jgi:hypothetical protein
MKKESCKNQKCTERTNAFKNGCKRFRDIKDCKDRFKNVKEGE